MKKNLYFIVIAVFSVITVVFPFSSCQKMDRPPMNIIEDPEDDIVRILAIGNSFSEDAVENYLYELADSAGIEVIIGNLYIGGASLAQHLENATTNNAAYSYRKINAEGVKSTTANTSMATALADEKWDYVSLQQVSQHSGQFETYQASLPDLFNYVSRRAEHANPEVKYILHQTWAYAQNSTHEGFANYGWDQMIMYNAIVDAVERAKGLIRTDLVIPAGTAIQNGRNTVLGDNFTRDGYHLNTVIGRYTAACTWFEALFNTNVVGNTFRPAGLSDFESSLAQHAAHFAVQHPNAINPMTDFQQWAGSSELIRPVLIDFGPTTLTPGWNAVTSHLQGGSVPNLSDVDGELTGVSLTITERFNGVNTDGVRQTTTDFNMSPAVAANSYFGNSKAVFSGIIVEKSVIKLSGFNKDRRYNFCYYGSRNGVNDNRETAYITQGANEATALLNTSNNGTNIVCSDGIQPNAEGEIFVTVTSGSNNTNGSGFYYLTSMRISPAD
jgi:hypothetical protein